MSLDLHQYKIQRLEKQIEKAYTLLSEWQNKKGLVENPAENRRCDAHIQKIKYQIENYDKKLDTKPQGPKISLLKTNSEKIQSKIKAIEKTYEELSKLEDAKLVTEDPSEERRYNAKIQNLESQIRDQEKELHFLLRGLTLSKRKYYCNRSQQEEIFEEIFQAKKHEKLQFYFVHGDKEESPEGFFRRLVYRYIQQVAREKNYIDRVIPVKPTQKNKVLAKLFKAFELNPNLMSAQDFNLRKLVEAPTARGRDYIAIKIKVFSSDWDETKTPEILKWFVRDFCQKELLSEDSPKLVFFFGLIHKQDIKKEGFVKRWLKGGKKERILKALSELKEVTVFPELDSVSQEDIEFWFEENFAWDSQEVDKIIKKHFPQAKRYPMNEVIDKLGIIIKEHNDQITSYES